MPTTKSRSLNLCFTKIQQTLSPQHDHNKSPFSSNSTTPSTLIKNFNSLYDFTLDSTTITPNHSFSFNSKEENSVDPDLRTAFASQRFFCSAPGTSSSILDSSPRTLISLCPSSEQKNRQKNVAGGRIAIPTVSLDPYMDFRQSMQEMVEARELKDVRVDWDALHELLMCFLALNPKYTHKFIFGAFADLLVSLMESFPNEHEIIKLSYFRSDRLL